MNHQRVVLGAWIGFIVLATVRRITDPAQKGLPPPSIYLGGGVLFTAFYALANFAGPLASALALGVDTGVILRPYLVNQPDASPLKTLGDYIGKLSGTGQPPPAAAGPTPSQPPTSMIPPTTVPA